MRKAKLYEERLRQVLLKDRTDAPDNLIEAIKSDIFDTLSNFFDINPSSVSVKMETDETGLYSLAIRARAFRVYSSSKTFSD